MHAAWQLLQSAVTPRLFILTLLTFSTTAFSRWCYGAERPNVLIFLIDDLGCRDLASEGSRFHATPQLDQLLASGVRFRQFYSSHPVCSPTRASLMTGKAPHHHRITDWIHPASGVAIKADEVTFAERFRESGYQTAYLGKWHLGESDEDFPTQHGFDWTKGVNRAGQPGSYYYPYHRPIKNANKQPKDPAGKPQSASSPNVATAAPRDLNAVPDFNDRKPTDYLTDVLSDAAIEYLVEHRDPERPFLMCVGHYAVHTPIEPPQNLLASYQAKGQQLFGTQPTPTIPGNWNVVSRSRQDHPAYAAMVENLDTNIGRVLKTLDEQGLRDNTIVVFTSDNGGLCTQAGKQPGPTCNLPYRYGKGWTYEGGIRITTAISWPAQLTPRTCTTPATTADLYPTLLELCNVAPDPQHALDGRSLAKVMQGQDDEPFQQRPLVWFYPHRHGSGHRPAAAIRLADWKLIHWFEEQRNELYQLSEDEGEQRDLSSSHPEKVSELKSLLDKELASVRDLIPAPVKSQGKELNVGTANKE